MFNEKIFYGLGNWKCYHSQDIPESELDTFKKVQIMNENHKGFIVIFIESAHNNSVASLDCYKKHATAILKSILIGKFPLPIYNKFKDEVDSLLQQTSILAEAIQKPDFNKYKLQKKLYFNID